MIPSSIFRLAYIFLLVVALPFLILGATEAYKSYRVVANFQNADGVVIDNLYSTSPDLQDPTIATGAYVPSIRFTTEQGDQIVFTDGVATDPPDYEIGETVEVLYDPQNPQDARIKSWKRLWLAPTMWIVPPLLPMIVLFVMDIRLKKQIKAK